MSRCKGCNAEIRWFTTDSGKAMPVDAKPLKVVLLTNAQGEILTEDGPDVIADVVTAWAPHWATCSQADAFRKRPVPGPVIYRPESE